MAKIVDEFSNLSECAQISYLILGCVLVVAITIGCWIHAEGVEFVFQNFGNYSEFENAVQEHKNWVHIEMNKLKSKIVAEIIRQESVISDNVKCNSVVPDCPSVCDDMESYMDIDLWVREHENETTTYGVMEKPVCTPRHSVAIIIPYRDRQKHLNIILKYLPRILQKQHIKYKIFVVEQVGNDTFNKGVLMNAGFLTVLELAQFREIYHCFIFHDVDLLPENEALQYTCPEKPRHMSVSVDLLDYKLPYTELAGGVFAIRTQHFFEVNGYSNLYWGWGGEDDDMGIRIKEVLKYISRPPAVTARYKMLPHPKRKSKFIAVKHKLISTADERYVEDGLSNVKYNLTRIWNEKRHIHLLVDVGESPSESELTKVIKNWQAFDLNESFFEDMRDEMITITGIANGTKGRLSL